MLGARGAYLAGQNLGKVVLGKLFDVASLGYYSFAFQTMDRLMDLLYPLPSALLPSLTQLVTRQERERLGDIFDQAFRLDPGERVSSWRPASSCSRANSRCWSRARCSSPAVPLLRVMALVPIARTAHEPMSMLFQAMHRPGAVLSLALLKFATEFSGYFILVPMLGMIGCGLGGPGGRDVRLSGSVVSADAPAPGKPPRRARAPSPRRCCHRRAVSRRTGARSLDAVRMEFRGTPGTDPTGAPGAVRAPAGHRLRPAQAV